MPNFSVSRKVPYTVDQVFAISSDVAKYKEFLPLVRRSIVRNKSALPDGKETFEAELAISYKKLGIQESLISQVVVDPEQKTVTAQSSQGPVKHLNSEWKIADAGSEGSEITVTIDYALKSKALQFVLSGMFDMAVRKVMTSFENRAKELYGSAEAKA